MADNGVEAIDQKQSDVIDLTFLFGCENAEQAAGLGLEPAFFAQFAHHSGAKTLASIDSAAR